ncbi:MAG: pyridoxine 5'-phosphate synthase [Candidatus Omnitrophica bacterium]|nr:pyridoxine 5'-phosphate synthase [Candidatus Omnitrophota bacterium]MCM8802102.1 pyridoxine 5'-phosphate synthase [Candidatus Omnitrophota bacterium]
MKLGVNVDHVATLRQARRGKYPDPVEGAILSELAGCDSIVCHLREDRRHIQERDVYLLRKVVKTKFNLEMALSEDIIKVALDVKPDQVTLVPEKREELTTEGGLDVIKFSEKIKENIKKFQDNGIKVSLFIEPDLSQIEESKRVGADFIEIHTGRYADAENEEKMYKELNKIIKATEYAISIGIRVNAGHGLDYKNVVKICRIKGIEELNIGYSIICRSIYVGIYQAVKEMKEIMERNERENN